VPDDGTVRALVIRGCQLEVRAANSFCPAGWSALVAHSTSIYIKATRPYREKLFPDEDQNDGSVLLIKLSCSRRIFASGLG
jgi:hypothetical protein